MEPVSPSACVSASLSFADPAPSLSTSPGTTVRLTCTLSSGPSDGSYYIHWFQQKPRSPPQPPWYFLYYYSDSTTWLGFGVPNHFSGSKDASANAGLLFISGLQPEDKDDCHCCIQIKAVGAAPNIHSVSDKEGVRQISGPKDTEETYLERHLGWSLLHDDLSFHR
ncbi:unnamed protein product [Nyctereutes procyonoides]|uniref:(raccoon dog) hypothetical protein n=1 Tax=Nyctereutes procyonoides TaxID=34880 RepID=A0A811XR07_NYCPR|nr:unnamed protein product [Nyctereutes procyonoides]